MAYEHILESVVSGFLTGGATAVTAVVGFFRDTKKRILDIETKHLKLETDLSTTMLSIGDDDRGIVQQVAQLRSDFDDWKNWTMQNWSNSVPVNRQITRQPSFTDHQEEVEYRFNKIEKTVRELKDKFEELDSAVSGITKDLKWSDEERSEQIHKIREELANVNGLMRGLSVAMGLYDTNNRRG